jgi:hypothetical protein
VDELQDVAFTTVLNREVIQKYLLKADGLTLFGRYKVLYEVAERLQLDIQEIWIVLYRTDTTERLAVSLSL